MNCYETLMLMRPTLTSEESSQIEQYIVQLIAKAGGKLETIDRWGKYRLAYPVDKHDYGLYSLVRYALPAAEATGFIDELISYFRIKAHEQVLRHLNVRLESGFTSYQKPEPLGSVERSRRDVEVRKVASALEEIEVGGPEAEAELSSEESTEA